MTENIKISLLVPNSGQIDGLPKNPRFIKDERFTALVKSLQDDPEMLSLRELIVYPVDGKYVVIAGNMRLRAGIELGMKEMPCKVLDEDTPVEKLRAYTIKDNTPFGENDWDSLANEWNADELTEWGLELPVTFNAGEAQEDDYEIPDEIQTDIVLGDLFEIGEHRLLCGDSTDSDQVAKLMNGEKADMVFTDPPYNIDYGNIKHPKFKVRNIENDNMSSSDFKAFSLLFSNVIKKFNKGCAYVCGAPGNDGRTMFMALDETLHNSTTIIWNKDQFTLGRGKYQNKYEPIWFGWVDNGTSFYGDRTQTNVWDIPRPKKSEEHPTMKPVELVAKAISHASRNNDMIFDLFLSSGTTMVASHQLNRKCYGMELDPEYCQVIIDRMKKLDPSIEILRNGVKM